MNMPRASREIRTVESRKLRGIIWIPTCAGTKGIETVLSNLAGIRGSLEGYVGQKLLPSMETLSLEAIETDETEA
jgi:hypothetical protein